MNLFYWLGYVWGVFISAPFHDGRSQGWQDNRTIKSAATA